MSTITTSLSLAAALYLVLIAAMVNYFAWRACTGRSLQSWQAALAELPLRVLGYGESTGRPLAHACCQRAARRLLLISIIVCAVFLTALTVIVLGSQG